MLIQNCLPIPTCKNTPNGGRRIATTMRSKSTTNLLIKSKLDYSLVVPDLNRIRLGHAVAGFPYDKHLD